MLYSVRLLKKPDKWLRWCTLKAVLRVVYDPYSTIGNYGFSGNRVAHVDRKLIARELGLVDGSRKVQRRQDLVDAEVLRIQAENDALDAVSVLLQKPPDRSCEPKEESRGAYNIGRIQRESISGTDALQRRGDRLMLDRSAWQKEKTIKMIRLM